MDLVSENDLFANQLILADGFARFKSDKICAVHIRFATGFAEFHTALFAGSNHVSALEIDDQDHVEFVLAIRNAVHRVVFYVTENFLCWF